MSNFSNALNGWLERTKASDRMGLIARGIFVDLPNTKLRLWGGVGALIDTDGERWMGWLLPDGSSLISFPKVSDIRDGASALIPITVGYLDEDTYLNLRNDPEQTEGRLLTLYKFFLEDDGSTRLKTPLGDAHRYRIRKTTFKQSMTREPGRGMVKKYALTVHVKNINEGRSQTFFKAISSTGQRERSKQLFNIDDDAYGDLTAKYALGHTINLDG